MNLIGHHAPEIGLEGVPARMDKRNRTSRQSFCRSCRGTHASLTNGSTHKYVSNNYNLPTDEGELSLLQETNVSLLFLFETSNLFTGGSTFCLEILELLMESSVASPQVHGALRAQLIHLAPQATCFFHILFPLFFFYSCMPSLSPLASLVDSPRIFLTCISLSVALSLILCLSFSIFSLMLRPGWPRMRSQGKISFRSLLARQKTPNRHCSARQAFLPVF